MIPQHEIEFSSPAGKYLLVTTWGATYVMTEPGREIAKTFSHDQRGYTYEQLQERHYEIQKEIAEFGLTPENFRKKDQDTPSLRDMLAQVEAETSGAESTDS